MFFFKSTINLYGDVNWFWKFLYVGYPCILLCTTGALHVYSRKLPLALVALWQRKQCNTCINTSINLRKSYTGWSKFLTLRILIQRTKNTLRSTVGLRCGTWRRMTTTKEHARSATRKTTCTRDGNASASGFSGTFPLPPPQTLLPPVRLPSSDAVLRPACSRQKALLARKAQLFRHTSSSRRLSTSAVSHSSFRCAQFNSKQLCLLEFDVGVLYPNLSDSNFTDKWHSIPGANNNNSLIVVCFTTWVTFFKIELCWHRTMIIFIIR